MKTLPEVGTTNRPNGVNTCGREPLRLAIVKYFFSKGEIFNFEMLLL